MQATLRKTVDQLPSVKMSTKLALITVSVLIVIATITFAYDSYEQDIDEEMDDEYARPMPRRPPPQPRIVPVKLLGGK